MLMIVTVLSSRLEEDDGFQKLRYDFTIQSGGLLLFMICRLSLEWNTCSS